MLHVAECYDGGVQRAIEAHVRLTPEHEHHILWTGESSPPKLEFYSSERRLPKGIIRRIGAVRKRVAELSPSVVLAHSSWAGVYSRAVKIPSPIWYEPHCFKYEDVLISGFERFVFRTAERLMAHRTWEYLVLTPHEANLARSLSKSARVTIVPNVATVYPSVPPGEHVGVARVAMIGRICAQKDPAFFSDVARVVRKSLPDTPFLWIGEGDQSGHRDLVDAGVLVTGWQDSAGLARELSAPVLLLHSASYEGFPLSVLDAVAFDCPIVVRDIPAFDGVGLLSVSSVQEAATAVLTLLEDDAAWRGAVERSRALSQVMNEPSQRAALRVLYGNLPQGVQP